MVVESSHAVLNLQNNDLDVAKKHLESALLKYSFYEEAVRLGSRDKWENWYRGEKKIDVNILKLSTEELLNSLNQ